MDLVSRVEKGVAEHLKDNGLSKRLVNFFDWQRGDLEEYEGLASIQQFLDHADFQVLKTLLFAYSIPCVDAEISGKECILDKEVEEPDTSKLERTINLKRKEYANALKRHDEAAVEKATRSLDELEAELCARQEAYRQQVDQLDEEKLAALGSIERLKANRAYFSQCLLDHAFNYDLMLDISVDDTPVQADIPRQAFSGLESFLRSRYDHKRPKAKVEEVVVEEVVDDSEPEKGYGRISSFWLCSALAATVVGAAIYLWPKRAEHVDYSVPEPRAVVEYPQVEELEGYLASIDFDMIASGLEEGEDRAFEAVNGVFLKLLDYFESSRSGDFPIFSFQTDHVSYEPLARLPPDISECYMQEGVLQVTYKGGQKESFEVGEVPDTFDNQPDHRIKGDTFDYFFDCAGDDVRFIYPVESRKHAVLSDDFLRAIELCESVGAEFRAVVGSDVLTFDQFANGFTTVPIIGEFQYGVTVSYRDQEGFKTEYFYYQAKLDR